MIQVLTEVTLEVGSLGEEVGDAVPLPEGEEVPILIMIMMMLMMMIWMIMIIMTIADC